MTKSLKTKLVVLFASLMLLCVAVLGLNQTLAKADSTYAGLTGTATEVTAEVAIEDGEFVISDHAEIKTVSPNGIRFDTTVKASLLEKLPADAQFGTLIVPTQILGTTKLDLTTASAVKANVVYANQYLLDQTEGNVGNGLYKATLLGTQNGDSFNDFLSEYYNVEISARSFVKYTVGGQEKTAYTDTISWSMAQVAGRNIALADTLGLDPEEVEFLWPIMEAGMEYSEEGIVLAENTTEGYEIDLTEKVSGDILKVYDMEMNDVTDLATGKTINVTVGENRGEMGYLAITERESVATIFTVADMTMSSVTDYNTMMSGSRDGYYVQTADIDMLGANKTYNTSHSFTGTYDGQGYSVINVNTNGLFGYVNGGTIKNLIIADGTVVYESGRGGAVTCQLSHNNSEIGGWIDNVYVIGMTPVRANTGTDNIGLLVGNMYGASALGDLDSRITNCLVIDNAEHDKVDKVGAIIGTIGGSANANLITNTFAISSKYGAAVSGNLSYTAICANYDEFSNIENMDYEGFNQFRYDRFGNIYLGAGNYTYVVDYAVEYIDIANSTAVVDAVDGGTFAFDQLDGKTVEMVIINNKQVAFTQSGKSITVAGSEVSSLDKKESEMLIKVGSVIYSTTVKVCDRIIDSAEDFAKYVAPFHGDNNSGTITGYFVQTKDLNMEGVTIIVNTSDMFEGIYDGQGYSLIGGTTNGWFGELYGEVKNLIIVGTTLSHDTFSGVLASRIMWKNLDDDNSICDPEDMYAKVDNVYVVGVNSTSTVSVNVGGLLAGKMYGGYCSLTNILVIDNGNTSGYTYAVLGQWASSAGSATLTNVHAITSKTVFADTKVPTYTHLHADYSAFKSVADLSGFKYLNTVGDTVTVGAGETKTVIYTANAQ